MINFTCHRILNSTTLKFPFQLLLYNVVKQKAWISNSYVLFILITRGIFFCQELFLQSDKNSHTKNNSTIEEKQQRARNTNFNSKQICSWQRFESDKLCASFRQRKPLWSFLSIMFEYNTYWTQLPITSVNFPYLSSILIEIHNYYIMR